MVLVLTISIIIDLLFCYLIPLFPPIFLYLKPNFFITISIIYIILNINNLNKIKILFSIIFIESLLFEKNYFLNLLIFFILYLIISYLSNKTNKNKIILEIIFIISFILYFIIKWIILIIVSDYKFSISFIVNQILYNIPLSIIFSLIFYYFFGIKKRYS